MDKSEYAKIVSNWIETEKTRTCSTDSQQRYKNSHENRFRILYDYITRKFPDRELRVLDVGRSQLTEVLLKYYSNVSTIGFAPEQDEGGHTLQESISIEHIPFDLNQAKNVELWPKGEFDLIVFCEVIEHLCEAPEYALLLFHSLLTANGHLFCSTPNAAALFKRYKLFFGHQPYAKIRYFSSNPGHYREYTKKELSEMGEKCGFDVVDHRFVSFYKKHKSLKALILDMLSSITPAFQWYQMILWKK